MIPFLWNSRTDQKKKIHSGRKQIIASLELEDTDLTIKGPEVMAILVVVVVIWEYMFSKFITSYT